MARWAGIFILIYAVPSAYGEKGALPSSPSQELINGVGDTKFDLGKLNSIMTSDSMKQACGSMVSCLGYKRDNAAFWGEIIRSNGLNAAEIYLLHKRAGFDESVLRQALAEQSVPQADGGTRPQAGTTETPGKPAGNSKGDPRGEGRAPKGTSGSAAGGAGSESAKAAGDAAAGGGGGEAGEGAGGEDRGDFRSLPKDQADAIGDKAKDMGRRVGGSFEDGKEAAAAISGGQEPSGGKGPGQAPSARTAQAAPGQGRAGGVPSVESLGGPNTSPLMPDIPKSYARPYAPVPAAKGGGPAVAAGPKPRPSVPGQGTLRPFSSEGGLGPGSGFGAGRRGDAPSGSAAAETPAKKSPKRDIASKKRELDPEYGELTPEEARELEEFLQVIESSARSGSLDAPSVNEKLVASEAGLKPGTNLINPLRDVRSILEKVGSPLGLREQAAVVLASRRLGMAFSAEGRETLFRALERAEPPPPAARERTWWEKFLDRLARMLKRARRMFG